MKQIIRRAIALLVRLAGAVLACLGCGPATHPDTTLPPPPIQWRGHDTGYRNPDARADAPADRQLNPSKREGQ